MYSMSITFKAGKKKIWAAAEASQITEQWSRNTQTQKKSHINCRTDSQKQTEAETDMRNRTTVTLIQAKQRGSAEYEFYIDRCFTNDKGIQFDGFIIQVLHCSEKYL